MWASKRISHRRRAPPLRREVGPHANPRAGDRSRRRDLPRDATTIALETTAASGRRVRTPRVTLTACLAAFRFSATHGLAGAAAAEVKAIAAACDRHQAAGTTRLRACSRPRRFRHGGREPPQLIASVRVVVVAASGPRYERPWRPAVQLRSSAAFASISVREPRLASPLESTATVIACAGRCQTLVAKPGPAPKWPHASLPVNVWPLATPRP